MYGECHAHLFMNGYDYKKAVATHKNQVQDQWVRTWFEAYRENGITFVRDGGDAFGVSQRAKELAGEYGIDYRTPIFAIHKNHRYGGIVGVGFDTMKEYHGLVKQAVASGADFIKIMISGIMDFHQCGVLTSAPLSEGEIREMIHIAHEEGMAVMVHANGAVPVRAAVLAGADSLEHGNYLDADCLQVMAESGTVWVPTLATIGNLRGSLRFPEKEVKRIYERAASQLRKGFEMGILMALGSDAGAYRVPHGTGILDELGCFLEILGESQELKRRLYLGESQIRRSFRAGRREETSPASRAWEGR